MGRMTLPDQAASAGEPAASTNGRLLRPGELICRVNELVDGGRGIRFLLATAGEPQSAFVVRHGGRFHGYLNRCAHRSVELDWMEGEFFDASGEFLVCATHGARYDPATGACIAGPCSGRGLTRLALEVADGEVRIARAA